MLEWPFALYGVESCVGEVAAIGGGRVGSSLMNSSSLLSLSGLDASLRRLGEEVVSKGEPLASLELGFDVMRGVGESQLVVVCKREL
jgi:hypothetical protein